ncbi:MAG: HPr-rel-A system PqqD family peptide chaperone [Gammaproteobacteria bacterium]
MISAVPPRGWLLRTWEDEAVAFDAASGDTHYLRPLTLALYETCRAQPGLDANTIAARTATSLNVDVTPDFLSAVREGLDGLRRIGLLQTP